MKKMVCFMLATLFVFGLTSCDDQGKKCNDPKKCPERYNKERHERRW